MAWYGLRLVPEIELSALISGPAKRYVEVAKESGARIILPEYRLVTPELVKAADEAKLQVVGWTANQPADWDRLLAAGVDAIISDDPAGLIAHLKPRASCIPSKGERKTWHPE